MLGHVCLSSKDSEDGEISKRRRHCIGNDSSRWKRYVQTCPTCEVKEVSCSYKINKSWISHFLSILDGNNNKQTLQTLLTISIYRRAHDCSCSLDYDVHSTLRSTGRLKLTHRGDDQGKQDTHRSKCLMREQNRCTHLKSSVYSTLGNIIIIKHYTNNHE